MVSFVFVKLQALRRESLDVLIRSLSSLLAFEGMMLDIVILAYGKVSLHTNISSVHFSQVIVFDLQSFTPT